MFEPITSAGSRSGVNWTRAVDSPTALPNDRAVSVLPVPGTSSRRMCPSARIPTRIVSNTERSVMTAEATASMISVH